LSKNISEDSNLSLTRLLLVITIVADAAAASIDFGEMGKNL